MLEGDIGSADLEVGQFIPQSMDVVLALVCQHAAGL
jgi:hypothetical protein